MDLFPKMPNSLQFASNRNDYGRMEAGGKTIRGSHPAKLCSTA